MIKLIHYRGLVTLKRSPLRIEGEERKRREKGGKVDKGERRDIV
jgi:hypothetical protein